MAKEVTVASIKAALLGEIATVRARAINSVKLGERQLAKTELLYLERLQVLLGL